MNHKIMLITYPDSMGGTIASLTELLGQCFQGAVGQVHLLPFFPSSGDRGFAPTGYEEPDPAFGTWEDVRRLADGYDVMGDFMINHLSRQSPQFQDFLARGEESPSKGLFLRWDRFWPGGAPTEEESGRIYKRKPHDPYVEETFADGHREKLWCTFSEEQIDLDLRSRETWDFIASSLSAMVRGGLTGIRLDAFAYAVKKAGTGCFFVEPEMWEMLDRVKKLLEPSGAAILPEMHEHYTIQMKLAERGYPVYDFALPMLTLYALHKGNGRRLKHWLAICPRNQFTTLDTHDGIGVVDVKDLMTDGETQEAVELLYSKGANVKRSYNSVAYRNLDIYQINCTYYSALGDNDDAYLLARAIQFFAPGVPQVYYVGMLAGANDVEGMERTKFGRNINRHNYTREEVLRETERPVVRRLLDLMRFRNAHPAFEGSCGVRDTPDHILEIERVSGAERALLHADLHTHVFSISCTGRARFAGLLSAFDGEELQDGATVSACEP